MAHTAPAAHSTGQESAWYWHCRSTEDAQGDFTCECGWQEGSSIDHSTGAHVPHRWGCRRLQWHISPFKVFWTGGKVAISSSDEYGRGI